MTEAELTRRLTALHPTARRQLAAMTDTTYRGPHRIYRPSLSERFLSAVEHPGWARWLPSWWTPIPPAILAFGLWLHMLVTGA